MGGVNPAVFSIIAYSLLPSVFRVSLVETFPSVLTPHSGGVNSASFLRVATLSLSGCRRLGWHTRLLAILLHCQIWTLRQEACKPPSIRSIWRWTHPLSVPFVGTGALPSSSMPQVSMPFPGMGSMISVAFSPCGFHRVILTTLVIK